MRNNDDGAGFFNSLVFFILSIVLTIILFSERSNISIGRISNKMIEECERELPRNVKCKIIAVEDVE